VLLFDVLFAESVQQSLEKKFGKAGGSIPITPSDSFEKRMGVSIYLSCYVLYISISTFCSFAIIHMQN